MATREQPAPDGYLKLDPKILNEDAAVRERDARTLIEQVKTPQLERDFRRLPLERALKIWELTNDGERKQLRPILLKKKSQLENRLPAQRAAFTEKLRGALSEKKAQQTAIPQALRRLFGHAAN